MPRQGCDFTRRKGYRSRIVSVNHTETVAHMIQPTLKLPLSVRKESYHQGKDRRILLPGIEEHAIVWMHEDEIRIGSEEKCYGKYR